MNTNRKKKMFSGISITEKKKSKAYRIRFQGEVANDTKGYDHYTCIVIHKHVIISGDHIWFLNGLFLDMFFLLFGSYSLCIECCSSLSCLRFSIDLVEEKSHHSNDWIFVWNLKNVCYCYGDDALIHRSR